MDARQGVAGDSGARIITITILSIEAAADAGERLMRTRITRGRAPVTIYLATETRGFEEMIIKLVIGGRQEETTENGSHSSSP